MEEYKKNSKMITFEVVETMLNKVSHAGINGQLDPNFSESFMHLVLNGPSA